MPCLVILVIEPFDKHIVQFIGFLNFFFPILMYLFDSKKVNCCRRVSEASAITVTACIPPTELISTRGKSDMHEGRLVIFQPKFIYFPSWLASSSSNRKIYSYFSGEQN